MSKKILCIGDSLALPGHLNNYEDTWFYKLKRKFPDYDFISFFKRHITTEILVSMGGGARGIDNKPDGADCLEFYMPNIVILQLGIVDCAPRLLFPMERKIISKLPNQISEHYISLIKKLRKRNIRNTLVPIAKFKYNLIEYLNRCDISNVQKVLYVLIPIPDQKMVKKNPNVSDNVNSYNEIIRNLENEFDLLKTINSLDPEKYRYSIYEDGYHPNREGHNIIASSISNQLYDKE